MPSVEGDLRKLRASDGEPVAYELPVGTARVPLNDLLGTPVRLELSGRIRCVACGRETRRSFNQGYCYPCFRDLAQCDTCIVRPELCHYHLGTCREPEWGLAHCMRPHVVYLANASGLKVGITRATQIPTRWLDQGASQALAVLRVASRRVSGLVEVACKRHVDDRTDWRRMLRGEPEPVDLRAAWQGLLAAGVLGDLDAADPPADAPEPLADDRPRRFTYPVLEYPSRVRSLPPEKHRRVEGTLLGVKGQYLLLDTGVLNVRRCAGYEARFTYRA